MWVYLRPDPYVCGEWDYGGLLPYLLRYPRIKVRNWHDPHYIGRGASVHHGDCTCHAPAAGGQRESILMVQVENEYASFGADLGYLKELRSLWENHGMPGPFAITDGLSQIRDARTYLSGAAFGMDGSIDFAGGQAIAGEMPVWESEGYTGARREADTRSSATRVALFLFLTGFCVSCAAAVTPASTAWHAGHFHVNVAGVVSRSDIVLRRPNHKPHEAMPLGNGRLGLAVWSHDGLTLQLNRADTLPKRLSPGQVVVPGLKRLTTAADYHARLDLYHGEFIEHGNGMTARVYVEPDAGIVVIAVTGANPHSRQSAFLYLWKPRRPTAKARDAIGVLSQTWKDVDLPGASGKTFGALAAITAQARNVKAVVVGPRKVKLSFRPDSTGAYRILLAAPPWKGGNAMQRARRLFARARNIPPARHRQWWRNFWHRAGTMKLSSAHGDAQYFENLRAIDLFTAAAENRGRFPGSQAGVGDLFSAFRDYHRWAPSAYWQWNLRMQVAVNMGAGLYRLNAPYFRLYRDNLANIEAWTQAQMHDLPGACVPETMRFNGNGFEDESSIKNPGFSCSAKSRPFYNARTITTGAEVSLWIWRQYLATQNRRFLAANFPVMAASARFLLAYAKLGPDGLLHTYPANAHETQWDVHDPTTDIAAMEALFPAVVAAAYVLHEDSTLAASLEAALPKIPPFPLEQRAGKTVIGPSYDENAPHHNTENIGLAPVWPYELIGDQGPLHALGVRTYRERPNPFQNDWSFDAIQAARLGLAQAMKMALAKVTEKYQKYTSGFAHFVGPEFYVEQIGVVAAALQQALVQDDHGLVRIAPAWPDTWNADATVYIRHRDKVDVQIRHGVPTTVVIEAGSDGKLAVRNPWPEKSVEVIASPAGKPVTRPTRQSVLRFPVRAGEAYVIERTDRTDTSMPFVPVSGTPTTRTRSLGRRHLGLP